MNLSRMATLMTLTGDDLVFAGGAPRSGLTLLRALMSAHPDVFCGPDSGLTPSLPMQWRDFSRTLGDMHSREFGVTPNDAKMNFARAMTRLLREAPNAAQKKLTVEKSPLNILAFTDLAEIFPAARFIHVVRDGRDVAASYLERDWKNPQTGEKFDHVRTPLAAAQYWRGLVEIGMRAQSAINDPARLITLRYEDVIREPAATLRALCRFLGLAPCPAMQRFHQRPVELVGLERESADRLARPLGPDRIGRWRYKFSGADIAAIETAQAPYLAALGYY